MEVEPVENDPRDPRDPVHAQDTVLGERIVREDEQEQSAGAERDAHGEREKGREGRHLLRFSKKEIPEVLSTNEDKRGVGYLHDPRELVEASEHGSVVQCDCYGSKNCAILDFAD